MGFELWLTFAAASAILIAIPGPTILFVVATAMGRGRRDGVAMALGVALGDLVAMTACIVGLGALILASATLFAVVKWAGALHLTYLALRLLLGRPGGTVAEGGPDAVPGSAMQAFRGAAIVTALNPKSIAFFVAFVPQFLTPALPLAPQFTMMIATLVTLGALNAMLWALMAGRLRDRLARPRVALWLARAGGAVLLGMAAATAGLRRTA